MDLSRFVRGGADAGPGSPTKNLNSRRLIASQAKIAPRGRFAPASPQKLPQPRQPQQHVPPRQSSIDAATKSYDVADGSDGSDQSSYEEGGVFDSTIHSDFDLSTVNGDGDVDMNDDARTVSDIGADEPGDAADETYRVSDELQRQPFIDQRFQRAAYDGNGEGPSSDGLSRMQQQFSMFQSGTLPYKSSQQPSTAVKSAYKPQTQQPQSQSRSNRFSRFQAWQGAGNGSTPRNGHHQTQQYGMLEPEEVKIPLPSSESEDNIDAGRVYSHSGPENNIKEDKSQRNSQEARHIQDEVGLGDVTSEEDLLSDDENSSPSERTPQAKRKRQPEGKRFKSGALDYEVDVLKKMAYSDLANEPFDSNPKATAATKATTHPRASGTSSIVERMEDYMHESEQSQRLMLSQLSLDDWEQAGDWFLERFGKVMTDLKDARRAKRQLTTEFEAEVAAREEAVREKREGFDRLLREMKVGGEGVLRGTPGRK